MSQLFLLCFAQAEVTESAFTIRSLSALLIALTVTSVVSNYNLSITDNMEEAPSLNVEIAILAAASTVFANKYSFGTP